MLCVTILFVSHAQLVDHGFSQLLVSMTCSEGVEAVPETHGWEMRRYRTRGGTSINSRCRYLTFTDSFVVEPTSAIHILINMYMI